MLVTTMYVYHLAVIFLQLTTTFYAYHQTDAELSDLCPNLLFSYSCEITKRPVRVIAISTFWLIHLWENVPTYRCVLHTCTFINTW